MDGSDNPAVGAVLLCILVVINAIHHGFEAALQEINENWLEEKTEEGDKKAEQLLQWKTDPTADNAVCSRIVLCTFGSCSD